MTREIRNHVLWMCLLWVVFSAIGEWIAQLAIDNWPLVASEEGAVTGDAIFFLLRATVPIFVLVVLIVVYSAIRFHVPDDDTGPAEAQYGSGWAFITGWVGLSVLINVIFIIHPGITGLSSLWSQASAAAAENPLEVDVTAMQWQWNYTYPEYQISAVNDLVVPVGRPIKFVLTSADVVHSFWVPAWGIKKGVIPGETRTLVVTPTKEVTTKDDPTARVQCAQICGVGHPLMRGGLRVISTDAFMQWVDMQKKMQSEKPTMNMSGDSMSGMSGSGDGASGDSMSGTTMPDDSMSGNTMSGGSMPGGADTQGPSPMTMDNGAQQGGGNAQ